MRDESLAKNEELFREVNERIETVSDGVPRGDTFIIEYLCECDRPDCYDRVKATREEYESVRAEATHFIVVPGHNDPKIERVALSNERFMVVEKEGAAGEEAEESDPRERP